MKKLTSIFMMFLMLFFVVACGKGYEITYVTNGGTAVETTKFDKSFKVEELNQIKTEKEGYKFLSWYKTQEFTSESEVTEAITESITLYAKWEINNYDIIYHLDGGVNNEANPVKYTIESKITLLDASKEEHKFLGWYKEDLTTEVIKIENQTGNINLYAKFEKESTTPVKEFDGKQLNELVGYDIYELIPKIVSSNYDVYSEDVSGSLMIVVDLLDWNEKIAAEYIIELNNKFEKEEDTFIVNDDYTIYLYADEEFALVFTSRTTVEKEFDPEELNSLFGFDIYKLIPAIVTNKYQIFDVSTEVQLIIEIDLPNWTEKEIDAYALELDKLFAYNSTTYEWKLNDDYIIYTYQLTEDNIYGIGIAKIDSSVDPVEPVEKEFDPEELNNIFGFDLYKLIPAIVTNKYQIFDTSTKDEFSVAIDLLDWTEKEIDDYELELNKVFEFNSDANRWIINEKLDIYLYQSEPNDGSYGIGFSSHIDTETPVDPVEPIGDIYHEFNIQNTTTSLTGSYNGNLNKVLEFATGSDKVAIKAHILANITGSAPAGLDKGIIFATSAKGDASTAYLEIDTLNNIINTIEFEFKGRDKFTSNMTDAYIEILEGSEWKKLENGNFYKQLTTEKTTISVTNISHSHFRLVFVGTAINGNAGQFKIDKVTLGGKPTIIETWSDAVKKVSESIFSNLNTITPILDKLTDLKVLKNSPKASIIIATSTSETLSEDIEIFANELLGYGFTLNEELTTKNGVNTYVYVISEKEHLSLHIVVLETKIEAKFQVYNPNPDQMSSIGKQQTINEFEVEKFGKSGLPSTGKYDVLIVPIEVSGAAFQSDYKSGLNLVFNGSIVDTGWQSVSSYYKTSSYGNLDLNFDIADKYVTSKNKSYYDKNSEADAAIIAEALPNIDSKIDFSKYDSNNDGLIDSVIFIYSVAVSREEGSPWWAWVYSAKYGDAKNVGKLDGKNFEYYMWASYDFMKEEIPGNGSIKYNAETYIHELGHLMGIPDFYSGKYNYGALGGWDMMDWNNGDHGPFNKIVFGWQEPLLATSGEYKVSLDAYSTDDDGKNSVILIPYKNSNLSDGNAFDEYILIMFYTPKGLYEGHLGTDLGQTTAGVVIYHVDARMNRNTGFWEEYFLQNNIDNTSLSSNYLVQILEADKNNSFPGEGSSMSSSDMLTSGLLNLNSYKWNQGGSINVSIEIASIISNNANSVDLNIIVQ